RRLQVADSDTVDAVDRGKLRQQCFKSTQVSEVFAVRRGVLTDQEQFAHTARYEPPGLFDQVIWVSRHERTTKARDRAERTSPVTPRCDLHRRHRCTAHQTSW